MLSKPFSLSKHERLKSKKQIDALFLSGKAFFVYPYKVKYIFTANNENPQLKFGISVPKRNFKKAVDRNRIKRLSREAYRLHKVPFQEMVLAGQLEVQLMFMYTHNELLPYADVKKAMIKCLDKLVELGSNNTP